jgi:tRNA A-37 threonylcarbamoyl transferase component Bud32
MSEINACPRCGKPIPPDAPKGICPSCLMQAGALGETGQAGGGGRPAPLPVEEVGQRFPEFEVVALLGAGGMGAVYKARQPKLDRFIALKILSHDPADARFVERFTREAKTLARLSHPNIVSLHDFGERDGLLFLTMDFVDGVTLRELLHEGKLPPEQALAIVPQICEALQYAHGKGVVHRDIKPENILLDSEGRVKVADFGIARLAGAAPEPNLTAAGEVVGTAHYMAPEQVERPREVDHRADIFALGVVFYEMLTGELPLGKFQAPSKKVQVDVRLDEVVLHALEKEPERRYQRASEVKTDVETIAGTPGARTESVALRGGRRSGGRDSRAADRVPRIPASASRARAPEGGGEPQLAKRILWACAAVFAVLFVGGILFAVVSVVVAIALPAWQRGREAVPAVPAAQETTSAFQTISGETGAQVPNHPIPAPVVVSTVPQSGASGVDPGLRELRVTFSKPMLEETWSWVDLGDGTFPMMTGKPRYLQDGRTCVLPVKLEPGRVYATWINTDSYVNFQDTEGRPAVPYLLIFETRE